MKIHSDRGGQSISDAFKKWAETAQIEHTTNLRKHGNQAHESMNKVFKVILNKELQSRKLVKLGDKRTEVVRACVEIYNHKPNVLYGASPVYIEKALSVFNENNKYPPYSSTHEHVGQ